MSVLLLRAAPWLAGILVLFGAGAWTGNHLNPWQGRSKALQAQDWQAKAQGEEAAKVVIAGQLVALQKQNKVNADVMQDLQQQTEAVVADRDVTLTHVRRLEQLLAAAAARPSAPGSAVSKSDNRPGSGGAGGDSGPTEVERLLIDARDEAKRNAARLNALIAEVTPQMTPK